MVVTAPDRPRTLAEGQEWLREKLAARQNPMVLCEREAAAQAIDELPGLDGERWGRHWAEWGARFAAQAEAAAARGDAEGAEAAWLHAYAFYFVGRYPCANHPRKHECMLQARAAFLQASRYFDPPQERVAVPFQGRDGEGSEVVFYLRKPKGVERPPVIVHTGGIDSWKEERHDRAELLLMHGWASVGADMPGTGESPVRGGPDAERQFTPMFEWLRARPDLDGRRIGYIGMSFGGYWATKLAHTHREYLRAVVSWGGGAHYGFQPDWVAKSRYADSYLMELIETRAFMMGLNTYDEWLQAAGQLSLLDQGVLDQPSVPLLLVNGKGDRQTPIEDLYLVLEHGRPKSARVFPGGHMGNTPQTFPTIVTWLREQLGD